MLKVKTTFALKLFYLNFLIYIYYLGHFDNLGYNIFKYT